MSEYIAHLARDKRLKKVLDGAGPFQLKKKKDLCVYLCASIMSQQLSTRVSTVIYNRFIALYNGKFPTPVQLLDTSIDTFRSIGLSNSKANYIQNVARFAIEQGLDYKHLASLDNESVINYLVQIKGVGRWTAEMLLMFALGREDVFAIDDWGIQSAMIQLYKLQTKDKKALKAKLLQISEKWSPYRTYACMHLWQWKDNPPL